MQRWKRLKADTAQITWKTARYIKNSGSKASRPCNAISMRMLQQGLSAILMRSMFSLRKIVQWWTSSMSNIEMGIRLIIEMSRLSTGYLFMLSDNRGLFRLDLLTRPGQLDS